MKKLSMILMMAALGAAVLSAGTIGSSGVKDSEHYSLEEMLRYAMEDEHMALAEYEAIMAEYGVDRPYSNIARAEETHIAYLTELYGKYGFEIPAVNTKDHVVVPASLAEAAQVGVDAEIANIAMYEKFLEGNLPDDVREVFTYLQESSEKHLSAFQRQLTARGGGNFGGRG